VAEFIGGPELGTTAALPFVEAMKRALSPFALGAVLVVVGLVALLAYGVASNEADRGIDQRLARGERPAAPALRLPRLGGGGHVALADYRGKVVVLNYWASWCPPCRRESPLLQRWHERIAPRGGTLLGVDVLDVTDDAKAFIREHALTYPMLRDGSGETQRKLGIVAYPETFVVDRRGRIAALRRGAVDDAFMRREVLPLLEEPA
jgi:cytochrome c biogenesis protein CcmG, thiol:disulfide interchange protein DsbE